MSRSQPLIAAAIIVKNEAEHLQRCLNSIKDFCDEIIVVDTGSTDNTVEIATAIATKVLHKEWKQDFAASRNFALDAVTAEWVLYIDADEELVMDDVVALRQQVADAQNVMAFGLRMHTQANWTPYLDYRMWRNRDDIRFIGEIHETTMDGIMRVGHETNRSLAPIDISIMHHGYEGDLTAKHQRNLPLLEAELKVHPEKINLWNHLGRVHLALGRPDLAERTWRTGINRVEQHGMRSTYDVQIYASLADMMIAQRRDALPIINRGKELDPNFLTFKWLTARQDATSGRFSEALELCDELMTLGESATSPEGAAYNLDMFGDWPRQLKIDCLYSSLRFTEAHAQLLLLGQEFETRSYRAKQLEVCEAFAEYERSKIPAIEVHEPIILDDVTFIIPVRIETADRLANVKALCRQLTNNYRAKVLVGCEAPDSLRAVLPSDIEVIHIDGNPDHPFHMTRVVNEIARHAATPFRVHLDTDALVPPEQLLEALRILRAGEADMVFPFNFAVGVPSDQRNTFSTGPLNISRADNPHPMGGIPNGLCQMWNAESFVRAGTENEFMIGWAPEDTERVIRLEILGLRVKRIPGPIFHMDHETVPGRDAQSEYHKISMAEMERIQSMTKVELLADIASWPWVNQKDPIIVEKIDADDLTVLIRVRIDSPDRLRNLVTCTNTLLSVMSSRIIVGIGDPRQIIGELDPRVEIVKVHDPLEQPFESMRIVNDLARRVTTQYMTLVDTDAVVPYLQWVETLRLLREESADLVYPYDGRTLEVSYGCHSWLEKSEYDRLPPSSAFQIHDSSVGACMAWNVAAFIEAGTENENFKSWGFEDDERFERFTKLGMNVKRASGVLYHIAHRRGIHSRPNALYTPSNQAEYERISVMSRDELREEIRSWPWRTPERDVSVLLWNDPWHSTDKLFDPSDRRLVVSNDRNLLSEADVVVIGLPALILGENEVVERLPLEAKRDHQKWVLVTREAASHFLMLLNEDFRHQFDVVGSYERRSAVWMPYVWTGILDDLPEIVPLKDRYQSLASVWISSVWDASGRLQFVSELMTHMQVESYGRKLNSRGGYFVATDQERKLLSAHHRFIFAFENARDIDYVTEKFFDPLHFGSVPVYWGAPNIEDFAPGDHCYINAADFASAKDLANFLTSMTDEEYMRYHEWRNKPLRESFVAMCESVPEHLLTSVVQMVRAQVAQVQG
jgi:glycosyltransferase involved in cell wall biosynthesis